jgi:hypothetical protein
VFYRVLGDVRRALDVQADEIDLCRKIRFREQPADTHSGVDGDGVHAAARRFDCLPKLVHTFVGGEIGRNGSHIDAKCPEVFFRLFQVLSVGCDNEIESVLREYFCEVISDAA